MAKAALRAGEQQLLWAAQRAPGVVGCDMPKVTLQKGGRSHRAAAGPRFSPQQGIGWLGMMLGAGEAARKEKPEGAISS